MSQTTAPRPYLDYKHLRSIIALEDGTKIAVQPTDASHIYVDAGWSDGGNAGTDPVPVDNIAARFTGHLYKQADGSWGYGEYKPSMSGLGGSITPRRFIKVADIVKARVIEYAANHAADLAQADDIKRNNDARTLEESIKQHEDALSILRRNLEACESGDPLVDYSAFPKLPTARR